MTYLYRCRECEAEWEAEQRITDPPLRECPECGAPDGARRLIAGTPGWHEVHRRCRSGLFLRGRA